MRVQNLLLLVHSGMRTRVSVGVAMHVLRDFVCVQCRHVLALAVVHLQACVRAHFGCFLGACVFSEPQSYGPLGVSDHGVTNSMSSAKTETSYSNVCFLLCTYQCAQMF